MKFKAGDRVKNRKDGSMDTVNSVPGDSSYDKMGYESANEGFVLEGWGWEYQRRWELITKGEAMGRRTFRLLKETDYLKRGAVFQEMCDEGDQDYQLLEQAFNKFSEPDGSSECVRSREAVENNPKWYEEVFPATQEYLTKAELEAFKKWQKRGKK